MDKQKKFNYPNGREWLKEDIEYLYQNYQSMSSEDIGKVLGRSKNSVECKLKRLGLKESYRVHRTWTSQEEEYLYSKYSIMSAKAIAKKLHRSTESVRRKANRMKIPCYTEYLSLSDICRAFKCDVRTVHRWHDKYGMPYRRVLRKQNPNYLIDSEQFWNWANVHLEMPPWQNYQIGYLPDEPDNINEIIQKYSKAEKSHAAIHPSEVRRIINYRSRGMTIKQIAVAEKRSCYSVQHILRNYAER